MNLRKLFGRRKTNTAQRDDMPSYTIDWEGHTYKFDAKKGSQEDFEQWFTTTALKLPACITCGRLIFPGQPVGKTDGDLQMFISTDPVAEMIAKQNRAGYMHMNWVCCPSGAFFFGYVNDDGGVDPAFESGLSAANEAMRTGGIVIQNITH